MGGPWIHRLADVDLENNTATCAHCGPTSITVNAAGRRCVNRPRPATTAQSKHSRKYRYGIDSAAWTSLLVAQSGRCAICSTPMQKPNVDHDHACCDTKGGKACGACVRGLLCGNCNRGLGNFFDNPSLLRAAIAYLEQPAAERP